MAVRIRAVFALLSFVTIVFGPSIPTFAQGSRPAASRPQPPPPPPPPLPPAIGRPVPLWAANTVLGFAPPPLQARAAFLMDMGNGSILYTKNPDMRLPMASTTKITTAVLTLEHANLHDLVTVSRNAATIGESTMGLRKGERVTVEQLLYGLLLNSGNDAAIALAEHVAGSEGKFVGMMNGLARSLGMRNTHYVTPHGLDAYGHYSSARDLATIATFAMRIPEFRKIVATTSYHVPATKHNDEHWLASVNRVLYWFPGVDGVKPGQTDAAGFCQVVSDWRNGRHLLAVLLNTPTLVFDIRNLLDYGSRDFQWVSSDAYWDSPMDQLSGGSPRAQWRYYFGAGHYVRGMYLSYFDAHGGLNTLGYPRTEQLNQQGTLVQYFQGGALAYDPVHHDVYPLPLGAGHVHWHSMRAGSKPPVVAPRLAWFYNKMGGTKVFGMPVSAIVTYVGRQTQFYQYGAIALLNGSPVIVPLGDAQLLSQGWLPATGAADAYPGTISSALVP